MQSLECNIFSGSFLIWFSLSSLYIPHFNRHIAIAAKLLSYQTNIAKENNKLSPNYCFFIASALFGNRRIAIGNWHALPHHSIGLEPDWMLDRCLKQLLQALTSPGSWCALKQFCLVLPSYLPFEIKTWRQSARLSNRLSLGNSQLMCCGVRLPVWNTKLLGIYSAFVAEMFE